MPIYFWHYKGEDGEMDYYFCESYELGDPPKFNEIENSRKDFIEAMVKGLKRIPSCEMSDQAK